MRRKDGWAAVIGEKERTCGTRCDAREAGKADEELADIHERVAQQLAQFE